MKRIKQAVKQMGSGRAAGKVLTPRRAATRAKLVIAARGLFAERGISGTSVEEISERAGFTRGAFYSNFDDIYDILTAVSAHEFSELEENLVAAWEKVNSQRSQNDQSLQELVTNLLSAIPVGREFYLVQSELALQMVRRPDLRDKLAAPRESFHAQLADFLMGALETRGLRLRGEARSVTDVIVALLRQVTESSLTSGKTHNLVDPSDHARRVIPLLITAVTEPLDNER